jgi:predicted Zn-dependent protease
VVSGAAAVAGVGQGTADLANMIGQVTFQLPFSREQESEADTIGLELMARAGYDPRAALTLWNKMSKAEGSGSTPQFLSTHPAPKERINDIEKYLPRVLPLYQQQKR